MQGSLKVNESIDQVNTVDDLVRFVQNLSEDFSKEPEGWENLTVDSYLESMAAWIKDFKKMSAENPGVLKMFASALIAAKYYE